MSQTIVNPVFDRTDHPELHVDKIEVYKDSTLIHCTLSMKANTWANISPDTYIENISTNQKYKIIRSDGIPFSPAVHIFVSSTESKVTFVFPPVSGATKINLIENPEKEAFNIYGISLTECNEESDRMSELKLISTRASFYATACDTIRAIYYKEQEKDIVADIYGFHSRQYLTIVYELCCLYEKYGYIQKANAERKQQLDYIDRLDDNQEKWLLLSSLTDVFSQNNNQIKALEFGAKAIEIGRIVWGTEHPKYASSLHDLSVVNYLLGNFQEAIRLGTEALEIRKKIHGEDQSKLATILSDLAEYYACVGNYKESIQYVTEALLIWKQGYGIEHPNYAKSLSNLTTYYAYLGNYEEAIRLETEALEIRKKVLGIEHPDYALSLCNLAGYNADHGNYGEAIRLGTEALEIRKKVLGTEHLDYSTSLSILATSYCNIGNYTKAIRLGTEALEIRKKILGTEHLLYVLELGNLDSYYSALGNYEEAIRLGTEALKIKRKVLGTDHPLYATSLNNLAVDYYNIGNYTEAIRLGTEALEIRKKVLGTEHPDYALSLNNLAVDYYNIGNYTEAIRLGTEALEIRKKILGTDHPHYALSFSNLSYYYSRIGNYKEAYILLKKYIELSHRFILKNFTEQSFNQKETFWGKNYEYYTNVLPSVVSNYKTAESIEDIYNMTCLFAKGLLLNSEIELRKQILESGDSALIDKYIVLSTNISIYNKLIEKPINERFMNLDSLNQVIEKQEMELVHESKVYGDYTHNLTCSWEDVRSKLGKADIAIEFISFPILGTDSTIYAALTLKKDYDSPHMVTLFEKGQLMNISDTAFYTQTSIYDLVWKPLEEEFENVDNIYFSPSGELHRIGIEYVPVSGTENISDKYTLHRLSSTRQLVFIQDGPKGEKSVFYGGIDYDASTYIVPDTSTSTVDTVRGEISVYRSNVDSLSLRSSIDYLEGSKVEIDQIADIMKQYQINYLYYSGSEGSEESFKMLDGTRPKMIHIATHGFYLPEAEAEKSNYIRLYVKYSFEDKQILRQSVEDKPMTRSGLLFSGCNHAINHEQIPDGAEDGILTAKEISMLDLRGLDLVVLSACQTALGDISSGEGVFGLQRGFKKAGANTILMSLDKVDDEATRILMVEFYKNLMSGKTKLQSLKAAQNYLRKYENGKFDDPKYWASFIMLDGLN